MLGLKRRKRQEGWAIDVEHIEPDGRDNSVRQKLADSDKLWVAAIVLVVLIAIAYPMLDRRGAEKKTAISRARSAGSLTYNDAAHRKFADQFVSRNDGESTVLEARFLNAKKFRITVRGDVGADAISDLASMAANRIAHQFKTRAAVQVYRETAAKKKVLVATAVWKEDQFGFVVDFGKRDMAEE